MIILDTNVVSELMRGAPAPVVTRWVQTQSAPRLHTTAVTLAEIRYGLALLPDGRRKSLLLSAAEEVFTAFADRVLPFDAAAAVHYADVAAERVRAGAPISGFDAQIGAISRRHHAVLATRNTADFDHLGLDVVNPWTEGRATHP